MTNDLNDPNDQSNHLISMLKRLSLFAFLVCQAALLFSQTAKPNYSLLWEVSGKDLPGNSYLFGTMHLRDERVFELADSVLLAIESCEAFAMEVHPDSAMAYLLRISMEEDTTNSLQDMLSEESYEEVEELLRDKTGRSLDSLKNKKPELLEKMLKGVKELPFTKKRPQILDLTLFGYASDRGKQMHGLERMEEYKDLTAAFFQSFDQPDTVKTVKKKSSFLLNDMIELYREGDIDKLIGTMNEHVSGKYREEMLTNRNRRMVEKMIGLGKDRSIFCAVGTAHLPGEDGIIALLRQEGYQVRRVGASFTGVADSLFQLHQASADEIVFRDEYSRFVAHLPTKPIFQGNQQVLPDGGSLNSRIYLSNDLRRGMQYMLISMDYPAALYFEDKNVTFESVDQSYEELWGPKLGKVDTIAISGFTGRGIRYRMQGNIIDLQMTMRANRFYVFAAMHPIGTDDSLGQRFFQNLELLPIAHSELQKTSLPKIGGSIAFPAPFETKTEPKRSYDYPVAETITYAALDSTSAHTYSVVKLYWSKYYESETPDSFLINYRNALLEDSSFTITDTVLHGMPSFYFEKEDSSNQYFADFLVMMSDTGVYELMVNKSTQGEEARSWEFFNSFEPAQTWTGSLLKRNTFQLIEQDIISPDSIINDGAKAALREMAIDADDLPALFRILDNPMDWDSTDWLSTHIAVLNKIRGMKDERILPFLKRYYQNNKTNGRRLQECLGSILADSTEAAYNTFFELAPTLDTSFGEYIYFYHLNVQSLKDSALVFNHLPSLLGLGNHPIFKDDVFATLTDCLAAYPTLKEALEPYSEALISDAWEMVNSQQLLSYDTIPDTLDFSAVNQSILIAGYLPASPSTLGFLQKMTGLNNKWLRNNVILSLFRQGQQVDKKLLANIHEDPTAWYYLLNSLHEAELDGLLPKKLLDAETFIEGGIPSFYEDEIDRVADFKIIEKRKHVYEGETIWLYVFTYKYSEEESITYLGICGQPLKGGLKLNPVPYLTSYEAYNGKNKEEIIMDLLKWSREDY